jgi:hypothetical protein
LVRPLIPARGGPGRKTRRCLHRRMAQTQNGAGVATGPVSGSGRGLSTPVGSQSSSAKASSGRARSGIAEASSGPSLQTSARQAPFPSVGRLSGEPATILRTSFRQAGDHSLDIFPASRRLSVRLFSTGRTRLPDRPFLSGRTLRSRCGRPFEQALQAAFRDSLARRLRSRRTPEKWVRLKVSPLPRASFRLPHQSVPGLLPEGYRPSRHWRRLGSPSRFRGGLPDREMPI